VKIGVLLFFGASREIRSMSNYRRSFVPGGSYFFTVNLSDRRKRLLVPHITELRAALAYVRARHPFEIAATVVLPDHLHAIWILPEGDADYALRWRLIKSAFSRTLPNNEKISASRAPKGERAIWQRRYWEHTLRDGKDFEHHVDYIHFNPVKHGYAGRVRDWPYSSFHRMVREGAYPHDWAGNDKSDRGIFGEGDANVRWEARNFFRGRSSL
jgi:putative transposase